MRVSEALELFRTEYVALRGLSASTEENYALAVLSFSRAIGDKELSEIVPHDFLTWRRWMEKRNKPGTIRCHMSKLKNILVFTNKRGITSFDISEIFLPKLPPPLPEYLNPQEIDRMIAAGTSLRDKLIISMMFCSGIRAGELCRLDKADIVDNQMYIRQGKCNTSRSVFIDSRTQVLLHQYYKTRHDHSPAVFYSAKLRRLDSASINKLIKLIAKRAGITRPVHSHMMRHSFATHLTRSGVDISYTQRLLGHAFVSTTQIYIHLTGADLQSAHKKVFN